MIASKRGRSDPPGRQIYCALQGRTQGERSRNPDSFTVNGRSYRPTGTKLAKGIPARERSPGSLASPYAHCDAWLGTDGPALLRAVSVHLADPDRVEALPLH